MNASSNIFDMFLGVGGPIPTLPQAEGNPLELGGDQPFSALFGSLLDGEVVDLLGQKPQTSELPNLQQPGASAMLDSLVGQMPQELAQPTLDAVLPNRFLPIGMAPELPDNAPSVQILDNQVLSAKMPMLMTESVQVDPERMVPGRYDVTEVVASDGKLNITLKNNDSEDAVEFRLSLPLEEVPAELQPGSGQRLKLEAGKVGVPARVALKYPGVSLAHLSEYGSGLNMKSVEIDLTQVNQKTASDEPTIDIKMFVEQQGREVIFRQLVPIDKVALSETRKKMYHPATANVDRTAQTDIVVNTEQAQTQSQTETEPESLPFRTAPRTVSAEADASNREFVQLFEKTEKPVAGQNVEAKDRFHVPAETIVSRTSTTSDGQEVARPSQPVRFTLPEGIDRVLKPGSRGIMIRIEPDNIGPARLNLAIRGGGLVGRVTVESAAVRTMVEGSLDQLIEQLNKAGIRVDSLEVGVGTNAEDQQKFAGQQQWGRQARKGLFASYMNKPEESGVLTSILPPGHSAQVGPAGVNLYA